MLNQILDDKKLNSVIAHNLSKDIFKNITDEEWSVIVDHKDTLFGITLQKIHDSIYNHYAIELLEKLHFATSNNIKVNADIYGGILEGIYNASLRTLCKEGRRRQENRKRKTDRNKA